MIILNFINFLISQNLKINSHFSKCFCSFMIANVVISINNPKMNYIHQFPGSFIFFKLKPVLKSALWRNCAAQFKIFWCLGCRVKFLDRWAILSIPMTRDLIVNIIQLIKQRILEMIRILENLHLSFFNEFFYGFAAI